MQPNNKNVSFPDELNGNYLLLLKFIDFCMSSIIITPCVIGFWRGAWQLADDLLLPQNSLTSYIVSFAFGCFGSSLFTFYQDNFTKWFDPDKRLLTFYIVSRIYTAVFGILSVHMWRGSFNLCDYLTGKTSLAVVLITTVFAVIILVLTKTTRNLNAPPFFMCVDHSKMYFETTTIFDTKKYHRPVLYFWDTFFSVVIIGTVVTIAWRGVWAALDLLLYPDNDLYSAVGSLKYHRPVLYFWDTFFSVVIIGTVVTIAWRGVWAALDLLLYPDNDLYSAVGSLKYHRPVLYFWDTFFSVVIIGTVVTIAWRGVWAALDLLLYPDNDLYSAVGSLIIGYGIECIAFALQPVLKRMCRNVNATFKLVLADSYYLITCIAAVAIWRGFWIILDIYLNSDNNLLKSYYMLLVISYIILTALNCANSVLVRGTAVDGDEKDNMAFTIDYVKLHVENRRARKE